MQDAEKLKAAHLALEVIKYRKSAAVIAVNRTSVPQVQRLDLLLKPRECFLCDINLQEA